MNAKESPITVLVVDDYEPLRSLLCRLFSRYEDLRVVGAAATGEEAIEVALACVPEVVVMDVEMPGIGGAEATRRLVDLLPSVRVIGYSSIDYPGTMRAAGAVDFVTKGSPPATLLATIRKQRPPGHVSIA